MKKYLVAIVIVLILLLPVVGASNLLVSDKIEIKTPLNTLEDDFTHSVFTEFVGTTKCGYCPTASSQLYSIYDSGDYNFQYVTLVADANYIIYDRVKELGVSSVPDVYFDGGYQNILGRQDDEQPYRNAIQQCGNRDVPDIDVDVNVQLEGNSILKISVTVKNNEPEDYNGYLRVYIVEIESRWNDATGHPQHFGVLYIPIEKSLAMPSLQAQVEPIGDSYTFTRTWIGALYGFGDITQDNIMVIATVFDPTSDQAVETASATPTNSINNDVFQFTFFENLKIWQWINARKIHSNIFSLI
jgi:hypothetical protein